MGKVINTLEALNAISQATGTYDFTSYSNFFKTGNVKGLTLIKDAGKTIGTTGTWGQIIPYTGELAGGASSGVSAINFSGSSAGTVTASNSGALIAVPAIQLVGAILAGLGLGIVAYEANPALWVEVSNKIFSIFPNYEPITADELPALSFTTLFKNGKTHVPDYLIEHSANVLNDMGAYVSDITISEGEELPLNQTVKVEPNKFSKELFFALIAKAVDEYGVTTTQPNPLVYADELLSQLMHYYIDSTNIVNKNLSVTDAFFNFFDYFDFLIDLSYNNITIEVNLYNVLNNEFKVMSKRTLSSFGTYTQKLDGYANRKAWEDKAIAEGMTPSLRARITLRYVDGQVVFEGFVSTQSLGTKYEPYYGFTKTSASGYQYSGKALLFFSMNTFTKGSSGINGINALTGAIIPSVFPMDVPSTFPEWWASRIGWSNLNPELETNPLAEPFINFGYLPLAVPDLSPMTNPVQTPQDVIQVGEVPATNPEPITEGTKPIIDDMPSGGGTPSTPIGDTPMLPIVPSLGGTATALYTVYNPIKSELNQLGSYLWSNDALTVLQQLFQNPLECIIGLHIIYATPATGSKKNIKLGYLDSGVSANEVVNQYVSIDCGTINIAEYFGDARDYAPYTQIHIYLPFIGIRSLNTNEIMAGQLNVSYKVDVLTGTVFCYLTVTKDGTTQVLYTYEGNCAVQLPLTGADKSRLLTGLIGGAITGGMIGGVGGAVVGAVRNMAGGIQINKTGAIGSNAGAMGAKKPYVIITRQKPCDAKDYEKQYGLPANTTVQLSNCRGYTRVKDVHIENILTATYEEKQMIESILKQGFVIE